MKHTLGRQRTHFLLTQIKVSYSLRPFSKALKICNITFKYQYYQARILTVILKYFKTLDLNLYVLIKGGFWFFSLGFFGATFKGGLVY